GWNALRYAYHKRLTHCLADKVGAAYPWTRYPRDLVEAAELECPFPVVLKPDAKPEENRFTRAKAWLVRDRPALVAGWAEAAGLVGPGGVIVQELVPGGGEHQYSFASLCQAGVSLASLVARRTRQYPRDFGHSSSLVETVEAPEVERLGRAIVEALGWDGLVEIEFKRDARDGSYRLLDINPRVWTWHALGPRAGVDFPYLTWRLSQGLPIDPVRARPGVRWVRLATDIPSALAAVRAGQLSLRGWAASLRRPRQAAVLAWDDPLPSLADPLLTVWRMVRRRADVKRRENQRSRPPRVRPRGPASRGRSAETEFV
ncbi:MAG: ATP-grasp domain-containing protein, partial [Actinobacteria bacterium]|nr:ATP-grasp domain-containing protein [Actinomycetota bacterium]